MLDEVVSMYASPFRPIAAAPRGQASNDDGCPHTLEHLVFMGADEFPYKGVLDHIEKSCYAQGTNDWYEWAL